MKHINKIQQSIAGLEYNGPADCVDLRLYLLSLMRELAEQYKQLKDRQRAMELLKTFKELESLYKSFTTLTMEAGRNYKAQFEFAKALISDQLERVRPAAYLSAVA